MKDVDLGPDSWESVIECQRCRTTATYESEDLQVGGFKADPNTYWFDGSATAVAKFFVSCPGCGGTLIVAHDEVPRLLQNEVFKLRNDGTA